MGVSIKPEIFISWIPNGKINFTPQIWASVIYVTHVEKITADTSRKTKNIETAVADSLRKIRIIEKPRADLKRNIKNIERAIADTSRKMGVEIANVDTCRTVKNLDKITADTHRKIGTFEKIHSDLFRNVATREKFSADTFLQIRKTERAEADTCRRLLERATADTFRKVVRPEKAVADTVIRIPHILNYIVQDSLVNSLKDKDITLFDVTLNERTFSDSFTIGTTRPVKVTDAVQGMFLDYPYKFLVEETTEKDLIYNIKGMYDFDKLLYSFIETDLHDEKEIYLNGFRYYSASSYVRKIAGYLGLIPNIKIEDFIPYNVVGNTNITYSDLIRNLFSWSVRLPQRQINVFVRGNILHCIQRGMEDSVFDISNIPHSRPVTNEKLIRTMYNSPFDNDNYDEEPTPYSGTISYRDSYSRIEMTYTDGLLMRELNYFDNGGTFEKKIVSKRTTYEYIQYKKIYYISHKNTVEVIEEGTSLSKTIVDTVYKYNEFFEDKQSAYYLTTETEDSEKIEGATLGSLETTEKTIRQTFHSPLGNGWYSTTVYEDGEYLGSSISQGAPTNQVSQFTTQKMRKVFGVSAKDDTYEARRSRLAAIADTSFPVRELDLVKRLTDDLKWLNRKIQVTVTVDLIDEIKNGVPTLNHVVDFTERVRLDGVEYFLVSNNVSLTSRQLIQKLQLLRWTE